MPPAGRTDREDQPAAAGEAAAPVSAERFGRLMARFEPFESRPCLAAAVSGGADSMALALLASHWARERHGRAVALIVDHGLRPGSAAEAERVAGWSVRLGLEAVVLTRREAIALGSVQAAARQARYRLLTDWCRGAGCLHLLTAHHRDDQAETWLQRLARGSGIDGLAAMPIESELADARLLRPFLDLTHAQLVVTCRDHGQEWVEDPSNQDPRHLRVRLRQSAAVLAGAGLSAERLAQTAARLGRARAAIEAAVDRLLGDAVSIHPAGFGWLDPGPVVAAEHEIGLRALARVLATIGSSDYVARAASVERLHRDIGGLSVARTLAGCRIVPRRGRLLICREPASQAEPLLLSPGGRAVWDERFLVTVSSAAPYPVTIGAFATLAPADRRLLSLEGAISAVPAPARPSLPVLQDRPGQYQMPLLRADPIERDWKILFRPKRPLSQAGFTVV